MTTPKRPQTGGSEPLRYRQDSPEFGRVVTLSDGVFAIALTLLVLTLDVPDVSADRLGRALVDEVQQVVVFVLSFALVAGIWWFHHKLVAQLALLEPAMIAMNLALLGLVALVPFPTNLVGNTPTARAAVLALIGVFLATSVVFIAILLRAQQVAAWRTPPSRQLFRWLILGWVGQLGGMTLAMVATVWAPLAGLVIAVATGTVVGGLLSILGPSSYRQWRARPGL